MKKILLSVFLVLITTYIVDIKAQILSNLDVGITASGVKSTIAVDYSDFYNWKTGFSTGLYVKYRLADPIAISLGTIYSRRGAKEINPHLVYSDESPYADTENRMDFIFNSIDMPLLAHIYITSGGSLELKVITGFSADFNKVAYTQLFNENQTDFLITIPYKTVDDISDRIMRTSFSGVLGVGADIDAAPIVLGLNLSYQMGLKNMNNVNGGQFFYNNYLALTLNVGYSL